MCWVGMYIYVRKVFLAHLKNINEIDEPAH